MNSAPDSHTANKKNLRRLFLLRCLAIAGQVTVIAVATSFLGIPLPLDFLGILLLVFFLFNLFTFIRLRRPIPVSNLELFSQLLIDVAIFSGLLYGAGGATNPFVLLYLIPIAIASITLPARYLWSLTAISLAAYSFLMWKYIPLPHTHSNMTSFGLHVMGMWSGFVIGSSLLAYFLVQISKTMRQQEKDLALAREQALKTEQLLALGTLAASTAHDLGTPLGTMSLIAEQLQDELPGDNDNAQNSIGTLQQQIARCKQTLKKMSLAAGNIHLEGGGIRKAGDYLENVLEQWRKEKPFPNLKLDWLSSGISPDLWVDQSLDQALRNVLDNAAEASPDSITCDISWDNRWICLGIQDRGPGFPAEAGEIPYSSKQDGLGLGLFLAKAIIEQLGGSLTMKNNISGATTLIKLRVVES